MPSTFFCRTLKVIVPHGKTYCFTFQKLLFRTLKPIVLESKTIGLYNSLCHKAFQDNLFFPHIPFPLRTKIHPNP